MNQIPIKTQTQLKDGKEITVYVIPAISFNQSNGTVKKVPHPLGTEVIAVKTLEQAQELVKRAGFSYALSKNDTVSEIPVYYTDYNRLIFESLMKLTSNETSNVVASAIKALGETQNTAAVSLFTNKLGEDNELIRTSAIEAICKFGVKVLPTLIETLKDNSWVRRNSAIICIGNLAETASAINKFEQCIYPLIAALDDSNTIVKASAARVLGLIYKNLNSSGK